MNILERVQNWIQGIKDEMPHELHEAALKAETVTAKIEAVLNNSALIDLAEVFHEEPLREELIAGLTWLDKGLVKFEDEDVTKAILARCGAKITAILHGCSLPLGKYVVAFENTFNSK